MEMAYRDCSMRIQGKAVITTDEPQHWKTRFLPMRKGADQLCSNCEANHRLCFRYTNSTMSLLLKSEISSF